MYKIGLTSVYKLTLGMKIVEREENLGQEWLQDCFWQPMGGVTVQDVFEAIPHRFLYETFVVSPRPGNSEHI